MRKNTVFIVIGLSIVFSLTTCKKDKEPGSIYGIILNSTGEPIRAANVQLNTGTRAILGNDGQYEFMDIKAGDYTLYVTKSGYKNREHKFSLSAGEKKKIEVKLEKLPNALRILDVKGDDIDTLDFGSETNVIERTFNIFNDSPENLEWSIEKNCKWITALSKTGGRLPAEETQPVRVTINRDMLEKGVKNDYILNINSNSGSAELTITAADGNVLPTLNILKSTNINATSATFKGEITDPGYPEYIERGFVYSTSQIAIPPVESAIIRRTVAVGSNTDFSYHETGLIPLEKYYVRAYAKNSLGTAYSTNEVNFTTLATLPIVTTQNTSIIDYTNGIAILNGTIVSEGIPVYSQKGFVYCYGSCYSPPTLEYNNYVIVTGIETGAFSYNLTLPYISSSGSTSYTVRAYAINANGTTIVYGSTTTFSFERRMPAVTTQVVSNINETTATFNGNITIIGIPAYTEKGFVYGTTPNPTIEDNTKQIVSGNGSGVFSRNITNLTNETTYYVRSYAISELGTVYGVQISFTTGHPDYVKLSSENLMIQRTDLGTATWNTANDMCNNSNIGGFTDWRLPTKAELSILYNHQNKIKEFDDAYYWSSTLYSNNPIDGERYYRINFGTGYESDYSSLGSHKCCCVRSLP